MCTNNQQQAETRGGLALQNYFEPEFNIVKVNSPDVICTSGETVTPPVSERDNAYLAMSKLGSVDFFIEV